MSRNCSGTTAKWFSVGVLIGLALVGPIVWQKSMPLPTITYERRIEPWQRIELSHCAGIEVRTIERTADSGNNRAW